VEKVVIIRCRNRRAFYSGSAELTKDIVFAHGRGGWGGGGGSVVFGFFFFWFVLLSVLVWLFFMFSALPSLFMIMSRKGGPLRQMGNAGRGHDAL